MSRPWSVYFLLDETCRRSYRGATVDLTRRLRQHRGELRGGARYTSRFQECHLPMYITGFPSASLALSYEWYTKREHLHCHHDMSLCPPLQRLHPKATRFFAPLRLPRFQMIKHDLVIRLDVKWADAAEELAAHYLVRTEVGDL